jgi:hypothetical protein
MTLRHLIAIALALAAWSLPAHAAPPGTINQYNAVCDPLFPTRCQSVSQVPGGATGTFGQTVVVPNGGSVALGSTTDAACATGSTTACTLIALIKWLNSAGLLITGTASIPSPQVISSQGIPGGVPMGVSMTGSGPIIQINGNAQGTTGAVVATLAAVAAKTTFICGFDVSAIGGTAAVGPVTVAGIVGSSQIYQVTSTAVGVLFGPMNFNPCIPASAPNTAITITTTADATATAVDVNSWGYQQ